MRKPMSPCYKCEFHSSTCHANCGFYQKFHDDLEEWNAIIRNGKKQLYTKNCWRSLRERHALFFYM